MSATSDVRLLWQEVAKLAADSKWKEAVAVLRIISIGPYDAVDREQAEVRIANIIRTSLGERAAGTRMLEAIAGNPQHSQRGHAAMLLSDDAIRMGDAVSELNLLRHAYEIQPNVVSAFSILKRIIALSHDLHDSDTGSWALSRAAVLVQCLKEQEATAVSGIRIESELAELVGDTSTALVCLAALKEQCPWFFEGDDPLAVRMRERLERLQRKN